MEQLRVAAKQLQLVRVAQQRQYAIADQVGSGLLAADHQENAVGDHGIFAQGVSSKFGRKQGMDQTALGITAFLTNRVTKLGAHLVEVAQHLR